MVKSLSAKGTEKQIVNWTKHLLTGRTATAMIGDSQVKRDVTTGVAEGGVASAPLFNCVGSEAVDQVEEETEADAIAFADDMNEIIIGYDLVQIGQEAQHAVNVIVRWATSNNLQFNASKTKAMLFTRKHKNRYKKLIKLVKIPIR